LFLPICLPHFSHSFSALRRSIVATDTVLEVGKVQTAVTADYQRVGQLSDRRPRFVLSSSSPLSDLNTLDTRPAIRLLMSMFGGSNTTVQSCKSSATLCCGDDLSYRR